MISAGCAPKAAWRCRHPIGLRRSARSRPWSTRTSFLQPRLAVRNATVCPARMRRCCAKLSRPRASRKGARRSTPRNTSGGCRRAMSAHTPRPTRSVRSLLFEKLNPILDQEKTRDAYRLEVDLLPMVLEMRRRGIRIDQDAAEQARDLLLGKRDAALAEISSQLGAAVGMDEINGRKWKEKTFEQIRSPIRARRRAIRLSRPANPAGWRHIRTGCRAESRSRTNTMPPAPSFSKAIFSITS